MNFSKKGHYNGGHYNRVTTVDKTENYEVSLSMIIILI
jgi:hypothetical protein